MIIKILGGGCANCRKLYTIAEQAAQELGVQAELVKVQDMRDIVSYGVMRTPALVINEKVKVFGKVPKIDEVKKYISEEM
ncbi:MAG TPA: thioredoxin family protein [Clostridia bacterium]|jgi:small redox-active disulfide protein 2|nr:thioredoxin family protein [Clostridia bacterium]